jgi:hypothetical protein
MSSRSHSRPMFEPVSLVKNYLFILKSFILINPERPSDISLPFVAIGVLVVSVLVIGTKVGGLNPRLPSEGK